MTSARLASCRRWATLAIVLLACTSAHSERNRQALEAFDLDCLRVAGVHPKGHGYPQSASVVDCNGYWHRVFVGNYMGRDHGLIQVLTPTMIKVREVIEAPDGEWVERVRWLPVKPP